ncbi:Rhodanese domain protein [Xylanimonas cellulosilytica DSM 15894]|uniref:Rhodanese domain protein n=1 Tax=Xylanimonas cellulosilytica (strain DSM 15894 / JCM 12276 / CECT 5975 / KCTC 9989 / LMG 20990 / NBRC 107835 / XIL07) TaxID=446471 RepID=D1BXA6_XYLCX|nr:sulfurtransferase [Xylanimonas cellulosilytica]ACZ29716.1 Rhodanese domain protein [Xylanimonas cellulosilytica DSM 15894]
MTDPTDPRARVLVTVAELAADLGLDGVDPTPGPPVLLDVRWALAAAGHTFDGLAHYRAGHLPGAVFADLETELAAAPSAAQGRHPLPSTAQFQAAARRWGLRNDSRVVVYDATGGMSAARAWWLLRYFGLRDVRILDGGLPAWQRAGHPLEVHDVVAPPGDVVLSPGHLRTLDASGAAALAASEDGVLLDARAGERYRGETEPVDPRAGHIPGAVSAPTSENLTDEGSFLPTAALRDRFAALGATAGTRVGVYCGSGVTAAHEAAALAAAGVEAILYPGSWSQWSNDASRPVATGATPV